MFRRPWRGAHLSNIRGTDTADNQEVSSFGRHENEAIAKMGNPSGVRF